MKSTVRKTAVVATLQHPGVVQSWGSAESVGDLRLDERAESRRRSLTLPALHQPVQRSVIASEHFRLSYPAGIEKRAAEIVLQTLETAQDDLRQRLQAAAIQWTNRALIQVHLHSSTADFVAATGQPVWAAGASRGNTMHLQPFAVLRQRGLLSTTLRHELAHVAIESLSQRRAPRWLSEGLAIHFAGEGRMYSQPARQLTPEELEKKLVAPASAQEMKLLYAAAYAEVLRLIREKGAAKVWRQAINS